jgi:ABC-type glycerol-3-phosphate transport system substrate-binding protein
MGLTRWIADDMRAERMLAIALLVAIILIAAPGCCAAPIERRRDAAADALASWRIVRRATVPHPNYGPAEIEALEAAQDALEAALHSLAKAEGN